MIHSDQSPHSQANRSSNTIAKRSRPVSSSDASAARVGGRENETQPIPKQNRSDEANQAISPPDHHDGSGSSMSTIDGDMFLRPDKDGEANEEMNRTSSPSPSRLPSSIRAAKLPPFSKKRNRKGGSKKKILKKSPDAPKRFKSRHKEIRDSMSTEERKSEQTTNIAQQISDEWRKLSPEARKPWDEMAAQDKERYEREKEAYNGPWKVAVDQSRKKKDPSAPKRGMSAFLCFAKTRRSVVRSNNPNLSNAEVSKVLSKMWKEAPPDVIQKYREEEKQERQRYLQAMEEWRKEQSAVSAGADGQEDNGQTISGDRNLASEQNLLQQSAEGVIGSGHRVYTQGLTFQRSESGIGSSQPSHGINLAQSGAQGSSLPQSNDQGHQPTTLQQLYNQSLSLPPSFTLDPRRAPRGQASYQGESPLGPPGDLNPLRQFRPGLAYSNVQPRNGFSTDNIIYNPGHILQILAQQYQQNQHLVATSSQSGYDPRQSANSSSSSSSYRFDPASAEMLVDVLQQSSTSNSSTTTDEEEKDEEGNGPSSSLHQNDCNHPNQPGNK